MTAPDLHGDDGLEAALRQALRGSDEVPHEAVAAADGGLRPRWPRRRAGRA